MPDYRALDAELAKAAYSGISDQAAADLLNAPGAGVAGTVSPNLLLIWAASTGVRLAIESKVADPALGAICLTIRDLLTTGTIGLDTANPANVQMLGALTAAGVVTQAQAQSLLALGSRPGPSAAAAVFGVPVSDNDIAHARSL
jgi:hypothetical protein